MHNVTSLLLAIAVFSRTGLSIQQYNQTTATVLCDLVSAIPRLKLLPEPWSCPSLSAVNSLSWCKPWTGVICSFGTIKKITSLTLQNNDLVGTLPSSLGLLTSLKRFLWIFDNHLYGTIPSSLGNLSSLLSLRLDRNLLTGTVPLSLERLTKLQTLNLNTNYLIGTLPTYFETATNNDDVQTSFSSFNQLTHYPSSQPTSQPSCQPSSQPSKFNFIHPNILSCSDTLHGYTWQKKHHQPYAFCS